MTMTLTLTLTVTLTLPVTGTLTITVTLTMTASAVSVIASSIFPHQTILWHHAEHTTPRREVVERPYSLKY